MNRPNRCSARGRRKRWQSLEYLEPRQLLAADPLITEFLASNDEGLLDGFGESSDWIELHNAGDQPIDLGGYHLTDDLEQLDRWTFPAGTVLDPNEYLVVFASGRDVVDPTGGLHTNFRIGRDGEILALVDAGGQIVSGYGVADGGFPEQLPDTSYGRYTVSRARELVSPVSPAQFHVPIDGGQDATWYAAEYADAANWSTGAAAVGFDRFAQQGVPVSGGTAVLQLDFGDGSGGETGADDTEAGWTNFYLSDSGSQVGEITVSINPLGGITLQGRDRTAPVDDPPSLTVDQLYDDFIFASSQTDETGLELVLQGLVPGQPYEVTLWSFDSGSIGNRVSRWVETSGPAPVEIESTYQFDGRLGPRSDLDDTMSATLTASASGELRIEGRRNGGTSFGVFLNAIQLVVPSIQTAIERDVFEAMSGVGTSGYLRVPFEMAADERADQLSLEMQYDSGFVAYLNGVEVARRGASEGQPLPFDATATSERSVEATLQTETIDLTAFAGLVNPGANVLAVHGLLSSASDVDFLIRPRLTATEFGSAEIRYFATPTPGEPNETDPFFGIVDDTQFSVDRGFYETPQEVIISSATPGAAIIYTLDGSLPSEENGTRVDAVSPEATPSATVTIATTSYLRAVAVKQDYLPSNVDTQTYIFLEDVLQQSIDPSVEGSPYPSTWQSRAYRADYDMDPEVVAEWDDNNAENDDLGIREALRSIPTMSLVMDHEDLWGNSGIYPRATSQGTFWRRAGSLEYIDPASGEQFQVNAGIQMHGGASRDNERTKKHSFRLVFSESFDGPPELEYPLFGDSPLESFNTIVLKSFFTDGFPTRTITGRYTPLDSQYLRDTWMRDVRLAMGGLDAASEYVHLYINGLYWGLYSPVERPDDAFLASYLGGEREDYDVVKDFNELFRGNRDAWNQMFSIAVDQGNTNEGYQRLQGKNPDGTRNPELPVLLDMDDLIEYMLLHLYAGPEDWPHHNWYAGRNRVGETTGFRFFTWDQEIVLDGRFRDRTSVTDRFTPAELYARLRRNEEFQLRFADRVYEHLFHDGALTVENAQASWMRRANQIEAAIIAESARWGDAREGERHRIDNGGPAVTIPTMTVDLWRAERDNVRDNYLPQSHELAIERFREDNLFPVTMPPVLSQRGGFVTSQTPIAMTGQGDIYYTLDGSDPRAIGGGLHPAAMRYEGPLTLANDVQLLARVRNGNEWSALERVEFEVDKVPAAADSLRVSELHYRPAGEPRAEFIEWTNTGAQRISLTGVHVTGGVTFDFADSSIRSLAPGERLLLVRDVAAFTSVYPQAASRIAGAYRGALANGGETLEVVGANDSLIQRITYSDDPALGWPSGPDGNGPSLQTLDPLRDCEASNCNWRPSAVAGGTPAAAEYPVGDANLDGVFNSSDLVLVFQAGRYELSGDNDARWADGDWNGDGQFNSGDLVFAFQWSSYVAAARAPSLEEFNEQSNSRDDVSRRRKIQTIDRVFGDEEFEEFADSSAFVA